MDEKFHEKVGELLGREQNFIEVAQEFCTVLRHGVKHYNWVGVYMIESEKTLVLSAWNGPAATEHTRIPVGKGVCGAAAQEGKTIIVDDVNKDPRYLQCFLNTKAEIVVPIFAGDRVVGEIDIDSDVTAAFGETDQIFLEWCAGKLGDSFQNSQTKHD